jgi:hypothetical protein
MVYELMVGGELIHGCNPLNSQVVTVDLRKAKRAEGWRKAVARSTELPVPKPAPLKLHCKQNHFNVAQVYMQTKTHAIFYAIWA